MNDQTLGKEVRRLEELWAGQFGQDYVTRNKDAANKRDIFWRAFLKKHPVKSVLEIGCNIGGNLQWLDQLLPDAEIHGIDINPKALEILKQKAPRVKAQVVGAKKLPFTDNQFDLVFTAGVLIHQPEESLASVMSEAYRVCGGVLLCLEYYSLETVEVSYRDQSGALFKRPYGELYQKMFPGLKLLEKGEMHADQGWDEVTYWAFKKG